MKKLLALLAIIIPSICFSQQQEAYQPDTSYLWRGDFSAQWLMQIKDSSASPYNFLPGHEDYVKIYADRFQVKTLNYAYHKPDAKNLVWSDDTGIVSSLALGSNGQILKSDGSEFFWFTPTYLLPADTNSLSSRIDAISDPVSNISSGTSRTIDGGGFQVSTTSVTQVKYSISIAATLSITGGQTGTVFLETSPNNSTWTEVDRISNGNTGILTVGLNITQTISGNVCAWVPAGYYVRLRSTSTGTPTITYLSGQETTF